MPLYQINGITLHTDEQGDGWPLLLLHGFTGSTATWAPLIQQLAAVRRCIAVDLIGHGASEAPDDPARYSMQRAVTDLLALLDVLGIAQADLLGYSLGGRTALQLAFAAPRRFTRLILESASPGLSEASARAERVASDAQLAEMIEREGLASFVAYWEALPLFASQQRLPWERQQLQHEDRLHNNPRGLANSLRGMGTGSQPALWDKLPSLQIPTLVIAGELDGKFADTARQMAGLLPQARLRLVPEAGHNVHLEQPASFGTIVEDFLTEPF